MEINDIPLMTVIYSPSGEIQYTNTLLKKYFDFKSESTLVNLNNIFDDKTLEIIKEINQNLISRKIKQEKRECLLLGEEGKTVRSNCTFALYEKADSDQIICVIDIVAEESSKVYDLMNCKQKLIDALEMSELFFADWEFKNNSIHVRNKNQFQLGNEIVDYKIDFKTLAEMIHPDNKQNFLAIMQNIYCEKKEKDKFECQIKDKNGKWQWFKIFVKINNFDNKKPESAFILGQSIEEKKQVELEVVNKERRYKSLFTNALDPMIIHNQEEILDVNPAACKLFGYSADEMKTMRVSDLNEKGIQNHDNTANIRWRSLEEYGEITYLSKFKCKDKSSIELEVRSNFLDKEKRVIQSCMRDMTLRRMMEKELWRHKNHLDELVREKTRELRETEKRFKLVCEAARLVIWDYDIENSQFEVNDLWFELYGYERNEVRDTFEFWKEHILLEDKIDALKKLEDSIEGKTEIYKSEFRIICKDGSIKWCYNFGRVMKYDFADKPLRLMGIQIDLSNIKDAEARLRKQNVELLRAREEAEVARITAEDFAREQITALRLSEELRVETDLAKKRAENFARKARAADKAKNEFLAKMSHEIRTPMNAIIGISGSLVKSDLDKESKRKLEIILSSGKSLLTILNDLLDFSVIETGNVKIFDYPFNFIQMIDNVVATMSHISEQKGLTLEYNIEGFNDSPILHGDENRIKQVLINLINNAIKFTEEGGIKLIVKGTLEEEFYSIDFCVKDTGIGIKKEEQLKIFEKFTQAANYMTRKFGGVGLGLPISNELIKIMGGELKVKSEINKGSEFYFNLKLLIVAQNMEINSNININNNFGFKVLLAEDNLVNQEVAKIILSEYNCEVEEANNGREAVEKVQASHYDVILMDLQMPEMDGYEATEIIRKFDTQTPIIALTGHALEQDKIKCLNKGMNDYLTKPVEPQMIEECFERIRMNITESDNRIKMSETTNVVIAQPQVLVVEDDAMVRRVIAASFELMGYKVIKTENGMEAVDVFTECWGEIDLVATDMRMPKLDGNELQKIMRKIKPSVKIIIITGYSSEENMNSILEQGDIAYLEKPFTQEQLKEAIIKVGAPLHEE